jgi:hypothetical protein
MKGKICALIAAVITSWSATSFAAIDTTGMAETIVYQDEIVTVLHNDEYGDTRLDSRNGNVVEIDITVPGKGMNGFNVGEVYEPSSTLQYVASVDYGGYTYHSYEIDREVIRVQVKDNVICGVTVLMTDLIKG